MIREQLVEERIFDGSTPITIGQSIRSTLSVPVEGLPKQQTLFVRDQDRWVVRVTPDMDVRLGQRDRVQTIANQATELAIESGMRGRLRIGDAMILFQEIATPPKAPRIALPASVRGTLADRVDRRLAAIIGGSIFLHIAIASWAWINDVEIASPLEAHLRVQYTQPVDIIDLHQPDYVPTAVTPIDKPGIAKPVAPTQTPRRIVTPTRIEVPQQPIDSTSLANILSGVEGKDETRGDMNDRQLGVDLKKQMEEVGKKKVEIGGKHLSRSNDNANIEETERPITTDQTIVENDDKKPEEAKRGRIVPVVIDGGGGGTDENTTLTAEVVVEWITTRYVTGLQRCYRKELVGNPTLAGKIKLSLTIDAHGQVSDVEAAGVNERFGGCVEKLSQRWRFPIPKKGGTPTDASFKVGLQMRPD